MINITHHGATTGVTGSCHELTLRSEQNAPAGILIDCGLLPISPLISLLSIFVPWWLLRPCWAIGFNPFY